MDERLRKNTDFRKAYEFGKSYVHPLLVLYVKPNNLQTARWGFAVSKRTFGKAVVRNRVKRRLREIARQNKDNVKKGFDMVFVGRRLLLHKHYDEIERGMCSLLRKAGLWEENRRESR